VSDEPLEQLNRFGIVIGALGVIFVALLATLLAWGAPDETITRVSDLASYLRRHNDGETKAIISLAAAVLTLLMLMLIIVELTPSPTQKMRVRSMTSGGAVITTSQIAKRIDTDVMQVPHIAQCAAIVAARGKKVEVVLDLHVDAGANLSQTADEACRRAHVLVEEQLGIEMAAMPRARLHYRELRLQGKDAAMPTEPVIASGWERPRTPEGDLDQRG
jgi:hypothetical protein